VRTIQVLKRVVPLLVTIGVFVVIFQRVPLDRLVQALRDADRETFLLLMIPNTVFYFCWDTLILTAAIRWFHGPITYRDLLPVRAASYVVAVFNTNLARGAVAAYLARRLQAPFLPLGSTVIFLLLTEYTHLVGWATLGMVLGGSDVPRDLLWVPPAVATFWLVFLGYARLGVTPRAVWHALRRTRIDLRTSDGVRNWAILQTFRVAPVTRYVQIIALRTPMFFVSLCFHYFAAAAFGIEIPFVQLLAFLPIIFMLAALPITVAHLGTTQAAWIFFFSQYAPAPRLLAFSLAAHATFSVTRALIGAAFTPWAYRDLVQEKTAPAVT
jgi:hypothetical protein